MKEDEVPHPHIKTLEYLPRFLALMPLPWPRHLEEKFGALRALEWPAWWARAKHHFDEIAIPVQKISSERDFVLRDREAEEAGDQITVVINLWYSKDQIDAALNKLFENHDWKKGNHHGDWLCKDFIIRVGVSHHTLEKIYKLICEVRSGKSIRRVADDSEISDDESSLRKLQAKGNHILKELEQGVFPALGPRLKKS